MSAPFFLGKVIDVIYTNPTGDVTDSLTSLCALLSGIFVCGAAANAVRVYLMQTAGQRIVKRLRATMFSSILKQEVGFFDKTSTGELINRLSSDTALLGRSVTENLSDGLRAGAQASVGVGMMFFVSPKLAAFVLSVVPPLAIIAVIYGRYLRKLTRMTQDSLAEATQLAEERIGNIRTVRAFGQEMTEIEKYTSKVDYVLQLAKREALARAGFFGATGLSGNMIVLSVLYKGGLLMGSAHMTVGELSSFLMYAFWVGVSIGGLSSFYSELMKGLGAGGRLWELIERKPELPFNGGFLFLYHFALVLSLTSYQAFDNRAGVGQRGAAADRRPSSEGSSAEVGVAVVYHAILTSALLLAVPVLSELGSRPADATLRPSSFEGSVATSSSAEVQYCTLGGLVSMSYILKIVGDPLKFCITDAALKHLVNCFFCILILHHSDGIVLNKDMFKGALEFKEIHFAYPTRPEISVFQDFSLSIPAGSVMALVGPSGSGKSTIVSLLLRLYDPISGSITVDGIDIRQLNPLWYRTKIGTVSQEPILFSCSIAENIAYGAEDPSMVTVEEIQKVAEIANAANFIRDFPEGFHTSVGEKGTLLSGGQKQRIAIARALLKNPKILLLDEATSALDAENEYLVQEALDRLMEGRTVLIIAHRLSTIQNADSVAVLDQGRITECGKHEELLANPNGLFRKLMKKQAFLQNSKTFALNV
ncbi:ATP-binding cassette sub-family B member 10 [Chelonia mydas]|uniref:ATP-binding cassette sub-family B member 10, mitochondrial n=1 Tax=Chelonia mydas TaxID=8469 RepID=M7AJ79_CHEMY|nr:ATP-binding cassette sub-family B member 10 [Chelonia mydas]